MSSSVAVTPTTTTPTGPWDYNYIGVAAAINVGRQGHSVANEGRFGMASKRPKGKQAKWGFDAPRPSSPGPITSPPSAGASQSSVQPNRLCGCCMAGAGGVTAPGSTHPSCPTSRKAALPAESPAERVACSHAACRRPSAIRGPGRSTLPPRLPGPAGIGD